MRRLLPFMLTLAGCTFPAFAGARAAAALAVGLLSVATAREPATREYGLILALPPSYFVSLGILAISFILGWRPEHVYQRPGVGRLAHGEAAVMNHSLWGRRKRIKQLVLACVIVALVTVLLTALATVTIGEGAGMAPPAGYSPGQLIFDDKFSGTSLNSAHWNNFMGGQGDSIWNSDGLPPGDSAAGTHFHQTYFSPSQVTVSDGLTLTMVPDTKYASLGYRYRSGVVTTGDKFTLRSGYVQIKAKMSEASLGGWPAIWFIDPSSGGGAQEIDLQEGGFSPTGVGLARGTPENNVFVSTYHTPSGSQSDFSYTTPKPMNAGFNIYGMEYIPGRSIKTYFNGRLIGSWTQNISTTPYEIVIWNTQASINTSGFHTTGESPDPSDLSVAEVQAYALPS